MQRNIALASLLLIWCFAAMSASVAADKKAAPVFDVRDINGKQIDLKTLYAGGPVIVWFWNSCCGIKKPQVQSLKELCEKYKDKGLQVLAISEDGVNKTAKTKEAVQVYKMPFIVAMDNSKSLMNKFQAFAVPSLYLVTTGGAIAFSHAGYIPGDEKKLEQALTALFAESKTD